MQQQAVRPIRIQRPLEYHVAPDGTVVIERRYVRLPITFLDRRGPR